MTIDFIVGRIEERGGFIRIRGVNVFTFHSPDTDALHAAGVYIPCIFDSYLRSCGMKAAGMLVIQPLLATDEYFPERPLLFRHIVMCFQVKGVGGYVFSFLHEPGLLPLPRRPLHALLRGLPAFLYYRGHCH